MHIEIDNVSELQLEKLEDLEKKIKIDGITVLGDYKTSVDCRKYRQILQKLNKLTEGIDPNWSNTKKFVLIYRRIASNIFYDHDIAEKGHRGQCTAEETTNCRNLINGLLLGKCVCAGYAEILRNACLLKGVNAIQIVGPTDSNEAHAWNQVEIDDGRWIEVDSTWDHDCGTRFIGTDREKFWESHRRYHSSVINVIESNEHTVSNFDLTEFINEEFGLNLTYYSAEEQKEFIDLLDKRDARGLDITRELANLSIRIANRRQYDEEFEQEVGYKIEDLRKMGISDLELDYVKDKFNTETGVRVDRRLKLSHMFSEIESRKRLNQKSIREFEQECGHTIGELLDFGFMPEEIKNMKVKFNTQTGERLNRRKIVEERIAGKQKEALKSGPTVEITKEQSEMLREQGKNLHPDTLRVIHREVKDGYITFDEAIILLKYKNGEETKENVESILQSRKEMIDRRLNEEFEQECGYTIEQLKKMGFEIHEIKRMKLNYDGKTGKKIDRKRVVEGAIKELHKKIEEFEQECGYTVPQLKAMGIDDNEIKKMMGNRFDTKTGEKIDRKRVVESAIKNQGKEHDGITLQKIGKGTLEAFKKNPGEAERTFSDLEQGIKRMNRENSR